MGLNPSGCAAIAVLMCVLFLGHHNVLVIEQTLSVQRRSGNTDHDDSPIRLTITLCELRGNEDQSG